MAGADAESAMDSVARARYDGDSAAVVAFWKACGAAFGEFPYNIGTVYTAPMQFGPSNLLWETKTGYRATMIGFPYDDLTTWRSVYPPEVFISQMEKVASGFRAASDSLRRAARSDSAEAEARLGEAAALHFQSTANQSRFVLARDRLLQANDAAWATRQLMEIESALKSEIDSARRLFALQSADSRLGFEASNHYYYVPLDLVEKVLNCRDLLERWLPLKQPKEIRP
jgi:hypothetical protein